MEEKYYLLHINVHKYSPKRRKTFSGFSYVLLETCSEK